MKKQWMFLGCGLLLGIATDGWSQTQRLVFSKRVVHFSPEQRDTVKIFNPNTQALVFDSLDAASSEMTGGLLEMGDLRGKVGANFTVFWGYAKATAETAYPFHTGNGNGHLISFAPRDTCYLGLKVYAACPVCNAQDMAAPADSLGMRLVFKRTGMTDTLFIRLDRRFTVALGPRPAVLRAAPAGGRKSDALGRVPRTQSSWPVLFSGFRLP